MKILELSALIFFSCTLVIAQTKPSDCRVPLWTAQQPLRNPAKQQTLAPDKDIDSSPAGVRFVDDSHLMVYEKWVDTTQLSSRESSDKSSPFRVQATILDARTGKKQMTKEWGTRFRDTSIMVTNDAVLLRTGDALRVLSKDLTELQQLPLTADDPYERWQIFVSPAGRTVLLNDYIVNTYRSLNSSTLTVFDGAMSKPALHWAELPALKDADSISDATIARSVYHNDNPFLALSDFGSKTWRGLRQDPKQRCSLAPDFVTNELLAYGCTALYLITTKGEVRMTDPFEHGLHAASERRAVETQNGGYIAVSLSDFRDIWDTGGRTTRLEIAVYGTSERRRLLTAKVSPLPKDNFDFALSPDGSMLAILNDRQLTVCNVGSAAIQSPTPTHVP